MDKSVEAAPHPSARMGFRTLAVHAGQAPDPGSGALATPIVSTSSYGFGGFDAGARRFSGEEPGYLYSRFGNPTVRVFERKIAALEGGQDAAAFASGTAAISAAILALVSQGEQVIYVGSLYGGTESIMLELLPRLGVDTVQADTVSQLEQLITARTRLIYVETPTNPLLGIHDLAALAETARRAGILTIADNTFATPYLTRPLECGIDVVVHSATKYISGHGDATGGAVIGNSELVQRIRGTGMKHLGGCMSPHDAVMFIRGLKTLPLRMDAACATAATAAAMLARHARIERVYYPGLAAHPGHAVARRQMSQFGAMLSFDVRGGRAAARSLLDGLELITQAVSVGDVDSLACHPASTTHSSVPEPVRLRNGVTDALVRLSIGVEDSADIVRDLEQALARI
jgi:methionine-gamma-lyase